MDPLNKLLLGAGIQLGGVQIGFRLGRLGSGPRHRRRILPLTLFGLFAAAAVAAGTAELGGALLPCRLQVAAACGCVTAMYLPINLSSLPVSALLSDLI